jgi:two-component system sensor histidine kinase/response regulator
LAVIAMKADLDACLAAGMNDYVTKPIDRKVLVATLRRWLPARSPQPSAATPAPKASEVQSSEGLLELEGIDVTGTIQRLGIDRATLERMLLRFAEGRGPMLDALRTAVAAGDGAAAARHAHAIAGAAGNLGADVLRASAKTLELAGREGRTDLTTLLADVEDRAAVVFRSIETLRAPAPVPASPAESFDPSLAGDALQRLTTALDAYDLSAANDTLADLDKAGLGEWAADEYGGLRRSVDAYEYDQARAIATRLLARVAVHRGRG